LRRRYRYELGARNQPSQYDIDVGALVAQRGRDSMIVGMEPVPCPEGGGARKSASSRRHDERS